MLSVRMLGRFEVISTHSVAIQFRSRKVGMLLAFLLLNEDRGVASHTLQELLWPDSDGDRQSQSLRRAIADLRDAFVEEGGRNDLVHTDGGLVSLKLDAIDTDVKRFSALLADGPESPDFEVRAAEAIALYGGPLLAPFDEDWMYAYRRHFEEHYCRAIEQLCGSLIARGQAREAVRISGNALLIAPYREEPYLSSIRAYAALDNRSMALRQYEALEKMLDDNFGQTPSDDALAAVDGPKVLPPTNITANSPGVPSPTSDAETRFYISREADAVVGKSLESGEGVTLVFGPRQVGKTSLLAQAGAAARDRGSRVVVTDLQSLGMSEIERSATLYRALIHSFATQLGLTYEPSWNEWIGANSNLDAHIDKLLKQVDGPVIWTLDEVDRLFSTEYADDFFGLVRSWHNRRALDTDGVWRRLQFLISYATEAHLFIKDLNQSPFNVGVRVSLQDFSPDEVSELAERYESPYSSEVFEITRGHPFLTRRSFAFLQTHGIDELISSAAMETGPFGDHLKRLLQTVRRDPTTEAEICRLLKTEPFSDSGTQARLTAAGLLSSGSTTPGFRVPAYGEFLRKSLG